MTSHYCEAAELNRLRTQKKRVPLFQKLQRLGTTLLEKQMVKAAQGKALIVPSRRMKLDMIRQHRANAESIVVVYSGVDSERYDSKYISLYRTDVRNRLSIGKDASVILFVGGEWERKGLAHGNPWIICTLWIAQYHIVRARRIEDLRLAIPWINLVCSRALPSGVLAEQLNPLTGKPVGVSPLTWSHATLVATVQEYIDKYESLQ